MFEAVCTLGLEGIVSKKARRAVPPGTVENVDQNQNPKAPAATRAVDGTF
jgi:hypothetical protein